MKDNRGFTLIELIVVMLIMAIVAVGSMAGYNLLYMASSKHTCERIVTLLDSVQMENMTKSKTYYMEIYQEDDAYIMRIISQNASGVIQEEEAESLELKNGRITFEAGGLSYTVESGTKLEVGFYKDTGAVKQNRAGYIITRIGVTSGGTTSYIRLVTATGKHYIE